jgi:hypothetical protein
MSLILARTHDLRAMPVQTGLLLPTQEHWRPIKGVGKGVTIHPSKEPEEKQNKHQSHQEGFVEPLSDLGLDTY